MRIQTNMATSPLWKYMKALLLIIKIYENIDDHNSKYNQKFLVQRDISVRSYHCGGDQARTTSVLSPSSDRQSHQNCFWFASASEAIQQQPLSPHLHVRTSIDRERVPCMRRRLCKVSGSNHEFPRCHWGLCWWAYLADDHSASSCLHRVRDDSCIGCPKYRDVPTWLSLCIAAEKRRPKYRSICHPRWICLPPFPCPSLCLLLNKLAEPDAGWDILVGPEAQCHLLMQPLFYLKKCNELQSWKKKAMCHNNCSQLKREASHVTKMFFVQITPTRDLRKRSQFKKKFFLRTARKVQMLPQWQQFVKI